MTAARFKKIIDKIMQAESFVKNGSRYYMFSPEIICIIGLQKSNYSNYYYLNVGYFIRQFNSLLEMPKETDGHIRARITFKNDLGKDVDYVDLDRINENDIQIIENDIRERILKLTKGYLSVEGLKKLLSDNPIMLYQTSISAKSLLGYT